jgi:hypothetical protein
MFVRIGAEKLGYERGKDFNFLNSENAVRRGSAGVWNGFFCIMSEVCPPTVF